VPEVWRTTVKNSRKLLMAALLTLLTAALILVATTITYFVVSHGYAWLLFLIIGVAFVIFTYYVILGEMFDE
jgi:hypothetical protein